MAIGGQIHRVAVLKRKAIMQTGPYLLAVSAFCILASCKGEDPNAVNFDERELAKEQVGQPVSSGDLSSLEELAEAHPAVVQANRCVTILHEFTGARRLAELDDDQARSNLAMVDADAAAKWLSIAVDREMDSGLSATELNRIQEDSLRRARAMETAELITEAEECAQEIPVPGVAPPAAAQPMDMPLPKSDQPE